MELRNGSVGPRRLVTRESALKLIDLESKGRLDERSEIGIKVTRNFLYEDSSVICHYECSHLKDNERLIPSHVYLTQLYLYILRPSRENEEGVIQEFIVRTRRKLSNIVKITKKVKMQDSIKIEYGTGDRITDIDRLHVPKYADKLLKHIKSVLQPGDGRNLPAIPQSDKESQSGAIKS